MGVYHLWDNFVGAPGTGTSGANEEIGSAFDVTVGSGVTKLRWRAGNTITTDRPSAMSLWDGVSGAQLLSIPVTAHSGLAGWQDIPVSPPYALTPGRRYVVSASYPSGKTYCTTTSLATAPPPMDWAAPNSVTDSSHLYHYPNSSSGSNAWWVDVEVDDSAGGSGGTGSGLDYAGAVAADNASNTSWLSTTANDYPTVSAPYLTWGIVTATKTELDAVQTVIDNLNNVIDGNSSIVALPVKAMLARYASDISTIEGYISQVPGEISSGSGGGGTAFYGPGGLQVAQGVEQLIALPNAVGTFPGAGWSMTDETDWTDAIAYAQPADLYVLDVYTHDANLDTTSVAGVDLYYRLGWWAPLNGTYLGSRRYVEFLGSHLEVGGQRMNGCLIALPKGGTGHVQAWTYTP